MDKIIEQFKKSRDTDDLMGPHNCGAGYIYSDMGVDIEEEREFQEELHGIVDKMKEDLMNESKILEGTDIPIYDPPVVEKFIEGDSFTKVQNELSKSNGDYNQWMTDLPNGSSTTDLTPISSDESNTSFSSVSSLNRARVIHDSDEKYPEQSSPSWGRIWANCGSVIGPLNELSDSMEQTISVPMLGTPSEEK